MKLGLGSSLVLRTILTVAALVIAMQSAAPASAATVMVSGTPSLDVNGGVALDISGSLGLNPGQHANFLSGTATFNFTSPDLYSFSGITREYTGTYQYNYGCGYQYYYCTYRQNGYNQTTNYAPIQSTAAVTVGNQSDGGASPVNYSTTFSGYTYEDCGSGFFYVCQNQVQNLTRTGHTNGPFSVTLNLNQMNLTNLSNDYVLSFDIDRSNQSVSFDSISFQGEYAIVTPGGIPEPATWAMMIIGFGAAGSMIRRRTLAA